MSFIAENSLTISEVGSSSFMPKAGMRCLFVGKDGWYDVDLAGNIRKFANINDLRQGG